LAIFCLTKECSAEQNFSKPGTDSVTTVIKHWFWTDTDRTPWVVIRISVL